MPGAAVGVPVPERDGCAVGVSWEPICGWAVGEPPLTNGGTRVVCSRTGP